MTSKGCGCRCHDEQRCTSDFLELADVTLNSGRRSTFKIEGDAITDGEWSAAADLLALVLPPYDEVHGIPRGGIALAERLYEHGREGTGAVLVVDDVFTTGGSMERKRAELIGSGRDPERIGGAVMFARGPCPRWVTPLFTLDERLWSA